jgi:hypothetical protein
MFVGVMGRQNSDISRAKHMAGDHQLHNKGGACCWAADMGYTR